MCVQRWLSSGCIWENRASLCLLAVPYTHNRDSALEIVQDTVVQAISHADALRDRQAVKPWIYRILVNESLAYLRRNKKLVFLDEFPDRPSQQEDLGEKMDVYRAVDHLEPKLKTIVILRYFEDLKLEEIAQATGANLNTVKARLYRALKKMREELGYEMSAT